MYNVCFHIQLALNYLKYDKKVPEKYRNELYKKLEALLKESQQILEEWK